jgi:hypothetical protein
MRKDVKTIYVAIQNNKVVARSTGMSDFIRDCESRGLKIPHRNTLDPLFKESDYFQYGDFHFQQIV